MTNTESAEEDRVKLVLGPYLNDLWIERRFKLNQVLACLEENFAPQSKVRLDWIQFIQFLCEHCSGLQFSSDKQWGELLNLMMISRKLNHKSVKLRDILANKQQIELNAPLIRAHNEAAQLGEHIKAGLDELEHSIQSCRIVLVPNHEIADGANCDMMMDEARSHLNDKCRPLTSSLRLFLGEEKISRDPRLEDWQSRQKKLSSKVEKMSQFVWAITGLQSKLAKIKHLSGMRSTPEDKDSAPGDVKSLRSEVRQSIELCRQEMDGIGDFYRKATSLIHQIANRFARGSAGAKEVALIKLFEPKEYVSVGDIQSAIDGLDNCRQKLDEIMQDLRREFGRFYFLNDLELLTVVMIDTRLVVESFAPDNKRIICKLFNNSIGSFLLNNQQTHLIGVQSPLGEMVQFGDEDFVPLKKPIQVYSLEVVRILNETQRKLRKTLKQVLLKSVCRPIGGLEFHPIDWSMPLQLINLAECVKFCARVEEVLSSGGQSGRGLVELVEFYEQQSCLLSRQTSQPQQESQVPRTGGKIGAAISMSVHFISLLMSMRHEKVDHNRDWLWQKQVRYYVVPAENGLGEELEVRIADARFRYKFDYLCLEQPHQSADEVASCFRRLIRTKVTERCFLVASQAVHHLRLGANPFGPAGGGKTETIKALGHLLGQQVIVHNCDETNDPDSLDRLVWGLAHTGLWGCFDEFNRLSSSTMSAISASLELVQSSIRENKTTVERDQQSGRMMCIDGASAFFITLNPASGGGGGYKGRRRLPANLRSLFLPISMVCVQIDSIVRESLLALSIELTAKNDDGDSICELGLRLQQYLLRLRELKLGANRCEWDLRLVMAALHRLRLLVRSREEANRDLGPLMAEAFHSEVEPRLSRDEWAKFCQLSREFGLASATASPSCCTKVDHLRRQLETRAGVLLVGPVKSGKSNTWRELFRHSSSTKWIALNPKFCSQQELFGSFVDDTTAASDRKRWRDGCFTSKVREALELLQEQPRLEQVCLILDGPIDPDWVESLNSVLDDNQVLTLGSGERLNFSPSSNQSIKLILETDSLQLASPATISRLGLVHFEAAKHEAGPRDLLGLQQIGGHLQEATWRLIIVCGSNLDYPAVEHYFRQNYTQEIGLYSCNQLSESGHLVDLLSWSPAKKLHLIHNLDLVGELDQWGARTFWEMLRFTIEYGGYYDGQLAFKPIEGVKFVLTCENLQQIDQRLASKASLVVNLPTNHDETRMDDELKLDRIGELLRKDHALIIFRNKIHLSLGEINRLLLLQQSQDGKGEIHLFDSSLEAQESLECLQKQVMQGESSSHKTTYVLHDIELRLMAREVSSRLLHLLNRLDSRRMRFILVCHGSKIPRHFKSRAARVFVLGDELASLQSAQDLLAKTFGPEGQRTLAWLRDKIMPSVATEAMDKERIDALVAAFLGLYQRTSSKLLLRQKALKSGLERLREFDERVDSMGRELSQQESMICEKNAQIDATLRSINSSLMVSQRQRRQLDELRQELQLSRSIVVGKSEQLELQLAQVSPKLEASKAEIRQHLKAEALNEIRTLRAPPKTIKDILDALFVFLDVRDSSWGSMKSYLASRSLRDELTNYQFESRISDEMLMRAQQLIGQRADSFEPDQARRASKAIVPLLAWIRAALEYGKTIIESRPLRLELQQKKVDLAKLNQSVEKAEADLQEINQSVQVKESDLCNLREEGKKLQEESAANQQQLHRSKQLRVNLESQTIRWDQDLHKINSLVATEDRLIRLCLLAASLAFDLADDSKPKDLHLWLREFDLPEDSAINWIGLIRNSQLGLVLDLNVELSCNPESLEELRIVQLVALRQFIELVDPPWLPFIALDSSQDTCKEEEMLESLCYGKILGFSTAGEIFFVRIQSSLVALRQMVARATNNQLGSSNSNIKLICLDVRRIDDELQLDLAHFLSNQTHSCKFILVGSNLGEFERNFARYLIRFQVSTARKDQDVDQVQARILKLLLKRSEPGLVENFETKQSELQAKQNNMRRNEISLLQSLASRTGENFSRVVQVLGELQQLNLELANDRMRLQELGLALDSKRRLLSGSSLNDARFYASILAPMRGFCRCSVDKYAQLLLGQQSPAQPGRKSSIARQVMLAMEPQQRLEFVERLRCDANWNGVLLNEALGPNKEGEGAHSERRFDKQESNRVCKPGGAKTLLGKTILRDVLAAGCGHTSNRCQLVIVLHDPSKSGSPQQELDYLFGGAHVLSATYDKIYATGNASGQLKLGAALRKFAGPASGNQDQVRDQREHQNQSSTTEESARKVRCLCIVNAHLSANWLNANLFDCLEGSQAGDSDAGDPGSSSSNNNINNHDDHDDGSSQLRVLILIGESADSSESLFDERILDYARLSYWHDELALSLVDRFDTFLGSQTTEGRPQNDNTGRHELRLQLILLHVVCQERTKVSQSRPIGWLHSYNFDHGQLSLALKTLERLVAQHQRDGLDEEQLRAQLSDYMADIVYGSRMEAGNDELELERLIWRFLRCGQSAREQLIALDELRRATAIGTTTTTTTTATGTATTAADRGGRQRESHDRLLAKLIGLPDC